MKLLITTQAVDLDDPILGFFHRWIEEFAKHFEEINVICLKEGRHSLPAHVHVHSLGKEKKISRHVYIKKFYEYVFKLHEKHDVVFSHMNPHYIVLAGWYWRLKKKRILFWRNHARINIMTYIAAWFSKKVFYTSEYACTTRFSHSVKMPVGIDTGHFKPSGELESREKTILFLGRLSKVKRPELFLESARDLPDYTISVYGEEPDGDGEYKESLRKEAGDNTTFYGSVSNQETPKLYSSHEIYVNLTPEGSMDKTILEAASCETLVLVANKAFKDVLDSSMYLKEVNSKSIQKHIRTLSELDIDEKNKLRTALRKMVLENHSLKKLSKLLHFYALP